MIRGNMTIQAISPKDLLIYLCLRRYRNSKTGEASVPITKIVKESGASPVTVLNSLKRLEVTGHIKYNKRGRANFYSFLSEIEAKSYDFLDEDLSHSDKIGTAVSVAFVPDMEGNDTANDSNRLYGYIGQLEEKIVQLSAQVRTLAAELDKTRKCTSVITGQEYTPLVLP